MKTRIFTSILILIVSWFLFSSPAQADGIIIPEPPICDPGVCPPGPMPISQLEIQYHHVDVAIKDQIAVTHVDQVFYNPNDWTVEGTYIFPIPPGATVSNFTLWIDGEAVEGEILTAENARRAYEEIVRAMKDPALLEYADQGALRAKIFPISPGGERRVELEYSEVLVAENGLVPYRYPLNTEKFSTAPLGDVRISVEIQSNSPIRATYSPSHPIAISKDGNHFVKVGYEDSNVTPDTDFVLYYSIGENEAFHLLTYRDPSEAIDSDGFFLLLLAPKPETKTDPFPKDIILVLDRSGSMEGEKFSQAQAALSFILQHLNPDDRFNIVSFSTDIETYTDGLGEISEIKEALDWVARLSPVGSTDINRALLETASLLDQAAKSEFERPTYIIFITDGLPTEGVVDSTQILNNFGAEANTNLRLFSFGVGYDVDTFLLDSLAENHHGTSSYVIPGANIDETLSAFYAKISTPVLTNLALDFGELQVNDIYPAPLPDLFAGSQIVTVGRYKEGGVTDVGLSGTINGETQYFVFPEQFFTANSLNSEVESQNHSFIPRLWATRKIGYLLNQIRLHGPQQELVDQVVRISIRFGIVTPYTSYLVTEPSPLGAVEQNRIAIEQFQAFGEAAAAPSYGQDAVEKAADQGAMAESEFIEAPMAAARNTVKIVGSRTFIHSEGVWIDTAFDPDQMQTVKVNFLSDDYFSLVEARYDLAAAFALSARVIAISNGIAYEVVGEDVPTEAIAIPPTPDNSETLEENPDYKHPDVGTESTPTPASDPHPTKRNLPCLGGLLPLLFFPLGLVLYRFNIE